MSPQFKHCPDPCFDTVDQYLKYFDTEMFRVGCTRT